MGYRKLSDAEYIEQARQNYGRDGEIEIDDEPVISHGEDHGAYVAAWVWVSDEDDGLEDDEVIDDGDL